MIKVYEYLDLVPDVAFRCDEMFGYLYAELKELYTGTALAEMNAQRMVDIVEDAVRCADGLSKEATLKRTRKRIEAALFEMQTYGAQMDFRGVVLAPEGKCLEYREGAPVPEKDCIDFLAEIRDEIDSFSNLLEQLCVDYKIKVEPADEVYIPMLSAWEGALVYYYEFDKFVSSKEDAENIIRMYGIGCRPDSVMRKAQNLRRHEDIVAYNDSSKDNKRSSLMKVQHFLKGKGLPVNRIEADIKVYLANKNRANV